MTMERFNALVEERFARRRDLMRTKTKEYVYGDDQLEQFKKAAALQGIRPRQACFGMMAKHIVSLAELCNTDNCDPGLWNEKTDDLQNYLDLLRAIVEDEATGGDDDERQ